MPVSFEFEMTIPRMNPVLGILCIGALSTALDNWSRDVYNEAIAYPPPPPASTYQRTYRLRRGWHLYRAQLYGDYLEGGVTNSVDYGPRVFGNNTGIGQARIHQNRWRRLLSIGSAVTPTLGYRAQGALNRVVQGAAFTGTIRVR